MAEKLIGDLPKNSREAIRRQRTEQSGVVLADALKSATPETRP